jgi:hypothetical protein
MAAGPSIDVPGWLEGQLAQASPDLLRAMVATFAQALMGAGAGAVCGAAYGKQRGAHRPLVLQQGRAGTRVPARVLTGAIGRSRNDGRDQDQPHWYEHAPGRRREEEQLS